MEAESIAPSVSPTVTAGANNSMYLCLILAENYIPFSEQ